MLGRAVRRRWLCAGLAQVVLFAQLATAAYACPAEAAPGGGQVSAAVAAPPPAPVTSAMAEMPGCEGQRLAAGAAAMDPEQPALCKAHCQDQAQTTQEAPAPMAAAVPLLVAVLDWRAAAQALPAHPALHAPMPSGAPPPGSPPLYLALQVLRN